MLVIEFRLWSFNPAALLEGPCPNRSNDSHPRSHWTPWWVCVNWVWILRRGPPGLEEFDPKKCRHRSLGLGVTDVRTGTNHLRSGCTFVFSWLYGSFLKEGYPQSSSIYCMAIANSLILATYPHLGKIASPSVHLSWDQGQARGPVGGYRTGARVLESQLHPVIPSVYSHGGFVSYVHNFCWSNQRFIAMYWVGKKSPWNVWFSLAQRGSDFKTETLEKTQSRGSGIPVFWASWHLTCPSHLLVIFSYWDKLKPTCLDESHPIFFVAAAVVVIVVAPKFKPL